MTFDNAQATLALDDISFTHGLGAFEEQRVAQMVLGTDAVCSTGRVIGPPPVCLRGLVQKCVWGDALAMSGAFTSSSSFEHVWLSHDPLQTAQPAEQKAASLQKSEHK